MIPLTLAERIVLRRTILKIMEDSPDSIAFRNRLVVILGHAGMALLRRSYVKLNEPEADEGPFIRAT